MSAPRALLLDFGGVISISMFERQRETETVLGLPRESLTWEGALAAESDQGWQAMQRGEITEREYWGKRASELGEALGETGWNVSTMLRRVRHGPDESIVRPQIRTLVQAARSQNIKLGILSNDLELFYGPGALQRMGIVEHFDAIVDASATNVLKPDPRAYALAVDALGVPAPDILFTDDQFRNIAGAVAAGLQVQHFDLRDVPGSIAAISSRLQLP